MYCCQPTYLVTKGTLGDLTEAEQVLTRRKLARQRLKSQRLSPFPNSKSNSLKLKPLCLTYFRNTSQVRAKSKRALCECGAVLAKGKAAISRGLLHKPRKLSSCLLPCFLFRLNINLQKHELCSATMSTPPLESTLQELSFEWVCTCFSTREKNSLYPRFASNCEYRISSQNIISSILWLLFGLIWAESR